MADKIKDYQDGFNHGYILAKYLSELANDFTHSANIESEYFNGLVSGKQEHQMEKIRERENPQRQKS